MRGILAVLVLAACGGAEGEDCGDGGHGVEPPQEATAYFLTCDMADGAGDIFVEGAALGASASLEWCYFDPTMGESAADQCRLYPDGAQNYKIAGEDGGVRLGTESLCLPVTTGGATATRLTLFILP